MRDGGGLMAVPDGEGSFSVRVPLAKVWVDEDGEMRFEGVASSTSLDRQEERMTPKAINKMATQTGLDLLPSHEAGALEELGVVEEAWADNDQFRVLGRLDKSNPKARRLFDSVVSGRQYGLSVGGHVRQAFWEYDEEAGRRIRHIDDVELDHVAVCRTGAAANPDTYLSVLAKAADSVMDEGVVDEQATLARIGQAAVHAARSLWPFAKSEGIEAETELREEIDRELAEVSKLQDQVRATLGQVTAALEELKKCEMESDEEEASGSDEGVSRALPGQERYEGSGMWGGVV